MRDDVLEQEVLSKCDVLKKAGFWPVEPRLRPRAWLNNFDEEDRGDAAYLLDKFTFYNQVLTDALFRASYDSIGDGLPKGPDAPSASVLVNALSTAIFTPVTGERPNPTDSGNLFCRKARQLLNVSEGSVVEPDVALRHAARGRAVVFVDDFIGSGDQFLETWRRRYSKQSPHSFRDLSESSSFVAIYLSLVSTDYGLDQVYRHAPGVAVCVNHVLGSESRIQGVHMSVERRSAIDRLLRKYSTRLSPKEKYIADNHMYLTYGYKRRGLMFGFDHSIPDATLPIFWSPGRDWEPLIERA